MRCVGAVVVICALMIAGARAQAQSIVDIHWVDLVRFHGITYVNSCEAAGYLCGTLSRELRQSDLGGTYARVRFRLDGNVTVSNYQLKDGDAAYLDVGATVYRLIGYHPTFRLAAYESGRLVLFEADTNPAARFGRDVMDLRGKVASVRLDRDDRQLTHLATIRRRKEVVQLVRWILRAPVDQSVSPVGQRYFIELRFRDGTTSVRAYWPRTNELARGILLPKSFRLAVERALRRSGN